MHSKTSKMSKIPLKQFTKINKNPKNHWNNKKNNVRDTNYFTKKITNWCGEWLLVNEKVILMASID